MLYASCDRATTSPQGGFSEYGPCISEQLALYSSGTILLARIEVQSDETRTKCILIKDAERKKKHRGCDNKADEYKYLNSTFQLPNNIHYCVRNH